METRASRAASARPTNSSRSYGSVCAAMREVSHTGTYVVNPPRTRNAETCGMHLVDPYWYGCHADGMSEQPVHRRVPAWSVADRLRKIRREVARMDQGEFAEALGVKADGVFGLATWHALRDRQAQLGLTPDGIAGPATLAKIGA